MHNERHDRSVRGPSLLVFAVLGGVRVPEGAQALAGAAGLMLKRPSVVAAWTVTRSAWTVTRSAGMVTRSAGMVRVSTVTSQVRWSQRPWRRLSATTVHDRGSGDAPWLQHGK
ncbi:hypothetical protein [Streptomyces sp. NPDC047718]|uniref:hypothetical protein n=1 Tax=Streptomyces sp. NPDC047718 TaxID=3155479 RepID=UPI0033D55525